MFRKRITIVMDIQTLPSEYKGGETTKDNIRKYEKDYGVKVIPVDLSPMNTQRTSISPYKL